VAIPVTPKIDCAEPHWRFHRVCFPLRSRRFK
jgi:hypothetical protein